jgi:hypothetical protein
VARIIRENDIDVDAIRDRVSQQNIKEAWVKVTEAVILLDACQRLTGPTAEILRTLAVARDALTDATE